MHKRSKLALVAAGILAGLGAVGSASAADMAFKAAPMPAARLYNWTGCYLGGNIGGGWTRTDTTRVFDPTGAPAPANYGREDGNGIIGGGQVGCDFQTGALVFGVGGSFDFGDIKGTHALTDFPAFTETNRVREIYTATGRVGYLWTPQFLGYVKGGVGFVRQRNQIFAAGGALVESVDFTQPAIVTGIGGEWMFAPNWSVFAEYNYMWTHGDDSAQNFTLPTGAPGEVVRFSQRFQTAVVGINYKLNWEGPLVAKY